MSDYGTRYADKKIAQVSRKLRAEYVQAEKELRKKLADFLRQSEAKDKYKQAQLKAGVITQEEYESWLKGQVFQKERWQAKVRQVQQVMTEHNEQAMKIINENKVDVYNENYLYQSFEMEGVTGYSFDFSNPQTVAKLIKDRDKLLPEWKIDEEKDYKWNYDKVNSSILQGIIQGEGVEKVMKRLTDNLCTQNENKMRMFARTAINAAQSAGRQQQMEDAEKEFGIKQKKEWLATLDMRTRDSHRHLDGQQVDIDKPFKSDFGDIMFPGDPEAEPADVFNCRCTIITIYPDYQDEQDNWRESETVDGMTYEEWKDNKENIDKFAISYLIDRSDKVEITQEASEMVNDAINKMLEKVPQLDGRLKNVIYGKEDGIASASADAKTIKLDRHVFSSVESMKKALQESIDSGDTVNAKDPMFIVAHEFGHCIENYIALKRKNLENAVLSGLNKAALDNERQTLGISYFLNMGFENETQKQIYDIIRSELGERALTSPSEMAAQAFAQVLYGEKEAPHAKKLVEYMLQLVGE